MTGKALQAKRPAQRVAATEKPIDLADLPRRLVELHNWREELRKWEGSGEGLKTEFTTQELLDARGELLDELCLVQQALNAGLEKASRSEIAKSLTVLAGCFPNADSKDLTVYGQMAVVDVASARPTRLQMQSAFTRLRRTLKFLPSIAEIMEALREVPDYEIYQGSLWDLRNSLLNIEKQALQIEQDKAQRRARFLEDAVRRLSDGKSTSGIPRDIVSEAKKLAGIEDEGGYW